MGLPSRLQQAMVAVVHCVAGLSIQQRVKWMDCGGGGRERSVSSSLGGRRGEESG